LETWKLLEKLQRTTKHGAEQEITKIHTRPREHWDRDTCVPAY